MQFHVGRGGGAPSSSSTSNRGGERHPSLHFFSGSRSLPASTAKSRTTEQAAVAERPFPGGHEVRDGEMPQSISAVGVGVDEASALGRNVFGVKKVVIPVSKMRVPDRRRLGKRLRSELVAVRDLLRKAEQYSCVPGAAGAGKDDRLFASGAAVEDDDDGCRAAKSRKVCPFAERRARESKPDDREQLAGRLASMAAALPDHVVAFLQNRRPGDADSRGDDDGEVEMDDVLSMKDGDLFLFQLKMLLNKFAPEVSTPKSRGGRAPPLAASGISCLSQAQHQGTGSRMLPVQEEEEEEGVNICGGVSRIAIRDIAEEYGELVDDIGVELLSPLQRKYVDLSEEDRYVDICGDASPVVFPLAKTGHSSTPSLSSSSDSDATSTDSDSSSSSPENSYRRAGEPVPAPEADPIQGVHNAQTPRPAPLEAIHISEPENQCAAATVFAVTKSPPAPAVLPMECGALAQPPENAPEAVQIAEPEELKEKCAAPGATVHPITGSAPPPAALTNGSGTSSLPAPVPVHIAEPEPAEPQEVPTTTGEAIAKAQQEWKRRAKAKARQVLLRLERAVPPDERIHPRDMELLGISAFEHVVSTVRDARTAAPQLNDGASLSFSPGGPSILQQLGVFLKADSGGEEEQPPPLAGASDGEEIDMEIEDGQII